MGFGDLRANGEDSDEDESNEYYTGGEKSGMVGSVCQKMLSKASSDFDAKPRD